MALGWFYRRRGFLRALAGVLLGLLLLGLLSWGLGWLRDWRVGLGLFGTGVVLSVLAGRAARWVPRRSILEIDFERGVVEKARAGRRRSGCGAERAAARASRRARRARARRRRPAGRGAARARRVVPARAGRGAGAPRRRPRVSREGEARGGVGRDDRRGQSATVEVYFASAFDQVHVQPAAMSGSTAC